MRIAVVADVHVANHQVFGGKVESSINARCRLVLSTLEAAYQRALALEVDAFVVAGDLFDTTKPIPQITAAVNRIFVPKKLPVVLAVGNHERVSDEDGDHAMVAVGRSRMFQEPTTLYDSKLIVAPFRPMPPKDWLGEEISRILDVEETGRESSPPDGASRLLVIHAGVRDEQTPPWLRSATDAVDVPDLIEVMKRFDIRTTIAGNWHDYREWKVDGREIIQIGSLAPTGFDNPGLEDYGGLAVFDTKTGKTDVEVIPGPRFFRYRSIEKAEREVKTAKRERCSSFVSFEVSMKDLESCNEWIAAARTAGLIVDGKAIPDKELIREDALVASEAARSAETLASALHVYVEKMPIADQVSREGVLNRCREYLKL